MELFKLFLKEEFSTFILFFLLFLLFFTSMIVNEWGVFFWQFGLDILDKSCQSIKKKPTFVQAFFFQQNKKTTSKLVFVPQMLFMLYFCVLVFSKVPRIGYIPAENVFFTFNCFVFFYSHVLDFFVGWGVLIWKDVALLGHGVVPFDNIFPKKSRKKKENGK